MNSKNTWFSKNYPNNKKDTIAYFSAEYGLDEILPIYSGGLGILSGDHLKSASDLGIPMVAIGLFYKNGYFSQKINENGKQDTEYVNIDAANEPLQTVKDKDGNDVKIFVKFPNGRIYVKVWQVNVGRVKLYLLDSDIEENTIEEYRDLTKTLYGGNQETRIGQEILLGMAGVCFLRRMGIEPTIYHMNEGHSAFLTLELIKCMMKDKQISFEMAKDMVSAKTVFTTHTPVPAGNDIFPIPLFEKYFKDYWKRLGITKEEFFSLGKSVIVKDNQSGFNMGILALRIAGKKNGVSKLHGAVSRELFSEVWPNIAPNESPIEYVTNGIHTCTWVGQKMKELYNQYLIPYWQDNIFKNEVWEKIRDIPNNELWEAHQERKKKLLQLVKENTTTRLKRAGYSYEQISYIVDKLDPNALTIGFARRFATYKRATLIFKDIERITEILNKQNKPVQIIIAGKAHPADVEGQELIKQIHEISMKPQFKGKIFLLENYNMAMSRYLIAGVDIWLNTPRRPMEASGTSGQKASVNGVLNFSILDGWWAEGYTGKNGWKIGAEKEYDNYNLQDNEDSQDIYATLENKIIPIYYNKNKKGFSDDWVNLMKESIITTGGNYSTARMLVDYTKKLYMPLINLCNNYYLDLDKVAEYNTWKQELYKNWNDIEISQMENGDNIIVDAGSSIEVGCKVKLPNILPDNVDVQVYCGRMLDNGCIQDFSVVSMERTKGEKNSFEYKAKVKFSTGGDFVYTFRVMPKHEMLINSANLNLVKWMTKEKKSEIIDRLLEK